VPWRATSSGWGPVGSEEVGRSTWLPIMSCCRQSESGGGWGQRSWAAICQRRDAVVGHGQRVPSGGDPMEGTPWRGPVEGTRGGDPVEGTPWRDPVEGTRGGDPMEGTPWRGPHGGDPVEGTCGGDPWRGPRGGDPVEGTPWRGPHGGDPMEGTPWRGPPRGRAETSQGKQRVGTGW
jgi:hypothetical protein